MKNWISRLAVFAVIGAVLSSAVLVGCGGGGEDDAAANATGNATGNTAPTED